jgi:hypothetical protein
MGDQKGSCSTEKPANAKPDQKMGGSCSSDKASDAKKGGCC